MHNTLSSAVLPSRIEDRVTSSIYIEIGCVCVSLVYHTPYLTLNKFLPLGYYILR